MELQQQLEKVWNIHTADEYCNVLYVNVKKIEEASFGGGVVPSKNVLKVFLGLGKRNIFFVAATCDFHIYFVTF